MRRYPTSIALALLVAAFWCAVPALALAGPNDQPKKAPTFAVKTFDGKTFKLSDFVGKGVVLDFWATWCSPCRASMPHLNKLQARYEKDGLVVLGLSVDELNPKTVKRFAHGMGIEFRMAMADEKVLYQYAPIRLIPTTVFIDRQGQVARRVVGYVDAETMESYVREILDPADEVERVAR